ncbi:MAG TPA: CHASE3 domain-containing protein, partial [Rhodopila sp.]|nr:CHASE3 domain-containing protein [Rhodopila sp.]
MSKKLVSRANVLVFGALIAFLALIALLTWDRFAAAVSARQWSQHSYQVLDTIRSLQIALEDAETNQRGYLLTNNQAYLTPYEASLRQAALLIGRLQALTADNQAQQDRLRQLAPAVQHRAQQLAQAVEVRHDQGLDATLQLLDAVARTETVAGIQQTLGAMIADEQALMAERQAQTDQRGEWVRRLALIASAIAILALIWAARLLNQAYARSTRAEADQRTLAGRLHATLDSLSQGVGVFGQARRLRHWNECFQVLLDLPPAMVRTETPYQAFVDHLTSNGEPLLEPEEQVVLNPSDTAPVVYERLHPDGRTLEIRRTSTHDGGFVLTVSDMTKRAQSEAVLREAQKMQAIGHLTGGIAHDFNNLLTVIMGNLELARTKLDPQSPLVVNIERSLWAAQRGGTLTGQLLAFARKQPLAPSAIDLSADLPELIPLLRRTLGEHIDVRFVGCDGLWPAMADPVQLESAVLNLALNARDAMPGGGRLTVEITNAMLDDSYAR